MAKSPEEIARHAAAPELSEEKAPQPKKVGEEVRARLIQNLSFEEMLAYSEEAEIPIEELAQICTLAFLNRKYEPTTTSRGIERETIFAFTSGFNALDSLDYSSVLEKIFVQNKKGTESFFTHHVLRELRGLSPALFQTLLKKPSMVSAVLSYKSSFTITEEILSQALVERIQDAGADNVILQNIAEMPVAVQPKLIEQMATLRPKKLIDNLPALVSTEGILSEELFIRLVDSLKLPEHPTHVINRIQLLIEHSGAFGTLSEHAIAHAFTTFEAYGTTLYAQQNYKNQVDVLFAALIAFDARFPTSASATLHEFVARAGEFANVDLYLRFMKKDIKEDILSAESQIVTLALQNDSVAEWERIEKSATARTMLATYLETREDWYPPASRKDFGNLLKALIRMKREGKNPQTGLAFLIEKAHVLSNYGYFREERPSAAPTETSEDVAPPATAPEEPFIFKGYQEYQKERLQRWRAALARFEVVSGVVFHNKKLLERAFTATLREYEISQEDNDTFEIVGDSILRFVLASEIANERITRSAGDVSKAIAILGSNRLLSRVAMDLDLNLYLRTHFFQRDGNLANETNQVKTLADTVEALIAGIYYDQGLEAARAFVKEHILDEYRYLSDYDKESAVWKEWETDGPISPYFPFVIP